MLTLALEFFHRVLGFAYQMALILFSMTSSQGIVQRVYVSYKTHAAEHSEFFPRKDRERFGRVR